MSDPLIDPELLKSLPPEQREEALAAARAAKRAEERAEQRALERALKQKEEERKRERELQTLSNKTHSLPVSDALLTQPGKLPPSDGGGGVKFIPKRKRLQLAEQQQQQQAASNVGDNGVANSEAKKSAGRPKEPRKKEASAAATRTNSQINDMKGKHNDSASNNESTWSQREAETARISYLGLTAEEEEEARIKKRRKQKADKKITFKFKWDESEDTFQDNDPLYSSFSKVLGRNNKNNHIVKPKRDALSNMSSTTVDSVRNKPLNKMTPRDWRIFRENYNIVVKGGRSPPPLRSFREPPLPASELPELHEQVLDSLENVLGFTEPTPIQRQAIPIGLQRRDLIGIAETGSGKTVAFGVPICNYIMKLPDRVLNRVADEGPLALIMAPTRELALQINDEISKLLSRQRHIRSCCIIGGQQLQHQANELRKGIHILVGTPGRINECIEMAYLVLNQCAYAVLDEGDRYEPYEWFLKPPTKKINLCFVSYTLSNVSFAHCITG